MTYLKSHCQEGPEPEPGPSFLGPLSQKETKWNPTKENVPRDYHFLYLISGFKVKIDNNLIDVVVSYH